MLSTFASQVLPFLRTSSNHRKLIVKPLRVPCQRYVSSSVPHNMPELKPAVQSSKNGTTPALLCGILNSLKAQGISAMLDWKINAVLHCIEGHVWRSFMLSSHRPVFPKATWFWRFQFYRSLIKKAVKNLFSLKLLRICLRNQLLQKEENGLKKQKRGKWKEEGGMKTLGHYLIAFPAVIFSPFLKTNWFLVSASNLSFPSSASLGICCLNSYFRHMYFKLFTLNCDLHTAKYSNIVVIMVVGSDKHQETIYQANLPPYLNQYQSTHCSFTVSEII